MSSPTNPPNTTTPNPQQTEAQDVPATADTGHATPTPKQPEKAVPERIMRRVTRPQMIASPPTPVPASSINTSPTERNDLTSVNAPPRERVVLSVNQPRPGAIRGLRESDEGIAAMYPQLGDTVQVDVDLVPYDNQTLDHQRLRAHSVNGRIGMVKGTEIQGNTLYLRIETSTANVLVPADAVRRVEPVPQPQQQHEPRVSPEKMRKPGTGAYKLT